MAGVRDHTELDAWKLADQVRVEVYRLCSSRRFAADRELRLQLTDAADSSCANIAEGFARFHPKEFARFLRISNGSQAEIADRLRSAVLRGAITQEEADGITQLSHRARGAATRLVKHLEKSDGPGR